MASKLGGSFMPGHGVPAYMLNIVLDGPNVIVPEPSPAVRSVTSPGVASSRDGERAARASIADDTLIGHAVCGRGAPPGIEEEAPCYHVEIAKDK